MILTTSCGSSATRISPGSAWAILPEVSRVFSNQLSSPDQWPLPTSTIGNWVIFPVCTRVRASNSSSSVPNPPGSTTNAWEYFTNMVLRTKK